MSTVANPPHYEPRGAQSKAISNGADLLVALFESEKAKVDAASFRQLKEVEANFLEYRQSSEQRIYDLEVSTRHANAALARSMADCSLAREHTLEAQQQCTRATIELSQLTDSLKKAGFFWDWKSLKLTRVGTGDVTTDDALRESAGGDSNVEELQKQLTETRRKWEDEKQTSIRLEQERDGLKAAMNAEVMVLKDRIHSLQNEAERLKRSSQLDGVPAIHPSTNTSRSENVLPPRLEAIKSNAKPYPPHGTPGSTSNNITVASNTTSSRVSDSLSSSSAAAHGSPSTDISNEVLKFQPTTSNSTNPAEAASRPLSAPLESSSLMEYHRKYHPSLSPKDSNNSFSKRPASAPLISFPEASLKRIKLDHSSYDKSIPEVSVHSQPLPVIDQFTVINHILPNSQMSPLNNQNHVQPPRPLTFISYLPKKDQELSSNSSLATAKAHDNKRVQ